MDAPVRRESKRGQGIPGVDFPATKSVYDAVKPTRGNHTAIQVARLSRPRMWPSARLPNSSDRLDDLPPLGRQDAGRRRSLGARVRHRPALTEVGGPLRASYAVPAGGDEGGTTGVSPSSDGISYRPGRRPCLICSAVSHVTRTTTGVSSSAACSSSSFLSRPSSPRFMDSSASG
jgi:hypothetical protein